MRHASCIVNPALPMDINELSDLINKGYGGRRLTSIHTERTDSILREVFSSVNVRSGLCLIAVGGYGRGELAPFSDVDIMLFAKDRSASEAAREILYKLWNTNLQISHSFRTPSDCINEANRDIKTKTSLLEHRYIAGAMDLYDYFKNSVYPQIAYRNQKKFITEKLHDVATRHQRFGDSVFMLEPHIKEGKGGLRDIHTILWLAGIRHRVRNFDELTRIIREYDFKRLERAYDFILKVRFCLHLLSGRSNDSLSFEFHDQVANMLNFKSSRKFFASERFMRYLYLKLSVIANVASHAMDICSLPYINVPVNFTRKKLAGDFSISKDRIIFTGGSLSAESIIEAFYIMSGTGKKFSPGLKEDIKKNVHRIDRRSRSSRKAIESFRGILNGNRVYETLREMHNCGVLGKFIPEFGSLSFLVVYEPYHRYTVDEHSLNAVKKLEELRATRYRNLGHLSSTFWNIRYKEALFFSLLLHDIGKSGITKDYRYGYGLGHHEEVGYRELKNVIERFNLDIGLRGRIEFLVKNHTLMSSVSFKREPDDPDVIAQFADEVADRDNLDALYLITYADMAAVGPDFWSEWKSSQLRELYDNALRYIEGFADKGTGLIERMLSLPDNEKAEMQQFLSVMPERYKLSTPQRKLYDDFKLFLDVREKNLSISVNEALDGSAEIAIGTWDRHGLFSRIAGAISSMGMNIYSARVYTGKNGLVIDKVLVSNWRELWWDGMVKLVERNLSDAVSDGDAVRAMLKEMKRQQFLSETPRVLERFVPFIELDNETSSESTVIEFFVQDRLGLLYDASNLMQENGIDIISARINTEAGLAHDIFYIRKDGGKIDGMAAFELLLSLWEILR